MEDVELEFRDDALNAIAKKGKWIVKQALVVFVQL